MYVTTNFNLHVKMTENDFAEVIVHYKRSIKKYVTFKVTMSDVLI